MPESHKRNTVMGIPLGKISHLSSFIFHFSYSLMPLLPKSIIEPNNMIVNKNGTDMYIKNLPTKNFGTVPTGLRLPPVN